MDLLSCKIKLNDNQVVISHSVEKSLRLIEQHGKRGISDVEIDATDGNQRHTYTGMSFEESLESLMNL
ncbi:MULTISPECIES: hypothetical protein [Vibrio]|uniref:Uncharacterized protein n=1 Tax=Vibrio proteolyticus NBRC 13287 TaxID=1219065 RepID=U3BN88_VIBPR|nr:MULTISPECIES: hypothetical protein [Vibrio]NAW57476.1 hypothetical protein [Vibrio sp. V36_P2S2PM302]NAX19722.1 hypothetical protein [Vibrio sp. V39_P1S14PM300]NAX27163.1 hypothetical protein [Vibrio sp. V38_P2S17PM301]NAX32386.1 hypothetical protein [Vibrio sp. V37_P2S8PM304]GAD68043.1 hypothetical protein VPR01S_11_00360 [Vibrio proteolyticus NBRC 13287]